MDNVYGVILAGGSGTRFWPKSRQLRPKQLCTLGAESATMIEKTMARLDGWIPNERRLIVTHEQQVPGTRSILAERCPTLLSEPEARNTAVALTLGALGILEKHTSKSPPIMISLHADHLIQNERAFRDRLEEAVKVAEQGFLTLIGIKPHEPETGYGYIEKGPLLFGQAHTVTSFREKPDLATAQNYVHSGKFLWNSGLFCWRVDVLLAELERNLPHAVDALRTVQKEFGSLSAIPKDILAQVYKKLPRISIDHAVLEVSDKIAVIEADMGWQDVGTWGALTKAFLADTHGNIAFGPHVLIDSHGTTIDTDGPFVAALGVENLIVAVSNGAVLVCSKDKDQEVKKIVDWLAAHGHSDLT